MVGFVIGTIQICTGHCPKKSFSRYLVLCCQTSPGALFLRARLLQLLAQLAQILVRCFLLGAQTLDDLRVLANLFDKIAF